MIKMNKQKRNDNKINVAESIAPRGIHHTVSYAVSFNDTWGHIKNELTKSYQQAQLN